MFAHSFKFLITVFSFLFLVSSCSESPAEKVEEAAEDVMEAREELAEARQDSMEYVNFKNDADSRLDEIDEGITTLKSRKRSKTEEIENQFDRDVQDLEVESAELREDLRTYTATDLDNWESYKFSMNERLNELKKKLTELQDKIAR